MGEKWKKFMKWRTANQKKIGGWYAKSGKKTLSNLQGGAEHVLSGLDGGGSSNFLDYLDNSSAKRTTKRHKKRRHHKKKHSGGRKGKSITIHFN